MRNLFKVLFITLFAVSCSSDGDNDCSQEVWGLSRTCTPNCVYTVSYGSDEDNLTTIQTNEVTFDYYTEIMNDDEELDCWEGEF